MLEMQNRGISKSMVEAVLATPDQIVNEYGGLKAYQSKAIFENQKMYLVRVIVDDTLDPIKIITVYRTSKFEKYWRTS